MWWWPGTRWGGKGSGELVGEGRPQQGVDLRRFAPHVLGGQEVLQRAQVVDHRLHCIRRVTHTRAHAHDTHDTIRTYARTQHTTHNIRKTKLIHTTQGVCRGVEQGRTVEDVDGLDAAVAVVAAAAAGRRVEMSRSMRITTSSRAYALLAIATIILSSGPCVQPAPPPTIVS